MPRSLKLLVATCLALGPTLALPQAAAAAPHCFGKPATMVGTSGNNTLIGTTDRDVIVGLGGHDTLVGRGDNDLLCGNGGRDELYAGDDEDSISGGAGADLGAGQDGRDLVKGDGGNDVLYGGENPDRIRGGSGNDLMFGNQANDKLLGGGGGDVLLGQQNNDVLNGGSDFDTASFYFANNQLGITADLEKGVASGEGTDALVSIEGLEASKFIRDDEFSGKSGINWFWPYEGDDVVDGRSGFDVISYFNSDQPMVIDLGAGTAQGQGVDVLTSLEGAFGGQVGDEITGTGGHNHLFGLAGNDMIFGLDGDDYLHGGQGGSDDGDGGNGTDGCVAVEFETSCELDDHPAAADAASYRMLATSAPSDMQVLARAGIG